MLSFESAADGPQSLQSLSEDRSRSRAQPDILCFSHLRWHFVTQRPQHLLTRAAIDRRVFFWEEPIWHAEGELHPQPDGTLGLHLEVSQEAPTLWVIRPHITWGIDFEAGQRILLNEFMAGSSITEYISWYYTPMALGFSRHLKPKATIYDCMDELSNFRGADPGLIIRERELFAIADLVFTGGLSLYDTKSLQHKNVHAFPSSIDVPHFAQAKLRLPDPPDQSGIPHPRAGFFGVIDERLDIELLRTLAALRPNVHFILIGPVVKIDASILPQSHTIHYLGPKEYELLPSYLAGWDVALMPFAINDSTKFISPTKAPEYLAGGKPVISTPIRDVVRSYGEIGLIQIAATPESFAEQIDIALNGVGEGWITATDRCLAAMSWDRTWAAMQREIDQLSVGRGPVRTPPMVASETRESHQNAHQIVSLQPLSALPEEMPKRTLQPRFLRRLEKYDYIVVGAGFAGSVLGERLASQLGKRVLVVDKRDHIAGNAYDFYNEHGILVHKYGPHIFHTNSTDVVSYLSQFTEWREYQHRVLSSVDGQLLPVPINLDTINRLYSLHLDSDGMKRFIAERAVIPPVIRTSEDVVVSRVGQELYEKFFRNYTRKQWHLDPSQLDASVAGRIPVRFDRDDRYFTDSFQSMPLHGYTNMFSRMLDHPGITVRTGVDYQNICDTYPDARVVYTGPIDEYFHFCYGKLPYISLEFRHETHDVERYQTAPVVNFPNDHEYTRITEFKYLTGQTHRKTSIVFEYPRSVGDPYYPVPRDENTALYAKYRALAEKEPRLTFCGRLANYRYLNMDQVVAQALVAFRRIAKPSAVESSALLSGSEAHTALAASTSPRAR